MSEENVEHLEILKLFTGLKFVSKYTLRLISPEEDGSFIIRSNLFTLDEAACFIEEYQGITSTLYTLCSKQKASSGLHFQAKWICHLAEVKNCTSEITISAKRPTTVQETLDEFLSLSPSLSAVIKIKRPHNHCPKIPKEICEVFYGYFNEGIKGMKAKRMHEKILAKRNIQALDATENNPHLTTVRTLYKKWKKLQKNAEVDKVRTRYSGPHACSGIDSAFISQEIKVEENYDESMDEDDYDPASNILNESVKIEDSNNSLDFEEIENESSIKIEEANEEDESCPDFNQFVIHQRQETLEIEEITEETEICQNMGLSFSNSQVNQLKRTNKRKKYKRRIKKKASHSKVSKKLSKNRNKHKSPKIVSCCSLNTRSQNNAMPSASVVTNSNSYYFSSTSVQTNTFVSVINPSPVPFITNVTTNVNTNIVCQVQRAVSINNSHLTLYDPSSNTYTVVQLCTPASPNVSSSNIYSAHFPNGIQSPTRVGINKF